MSGETGGGLTAEDGGPECETCGKTDCPDAGLPGFSEPRDCIYKPIYDALRDAKDCDYGCARDYTNQAVRLWVVEAVERILADRDAALARVEALRDDLLAFNPGHGDFLTAGKSLDAALHLDPSEEASDASMVPWEEINLGEHDEVIEGFVSDVDALRAPRTDPSETASETPPS